MNISTQPTAHSFRVRQIVVVVVAMVSLGAGSAAEVTASARTATGTATEKVHTVVVTPEIVEVTAEIAGRPPRPQAGWRCSWSAGCGYVFNRTETGILAGWYPGMFPANPHLGWLASIGLGPISLQGLSDAMMYPIKWTAIGAKRIGRCVGVRPGGVGAYVAPCP